MAPNNKTRLLVSIKVAAHYWLIAYFVKPVWYEMVNFYVNVVNVFGYNISFFSFFFFTKKSPMFKGEYVVNK